MKEMNELLVKRFIDMDILCLNESFDRNCNIHSFLNRITNNNWTFTINSTEYNQNIEEYTSCITLYVPGRVMTGVGSMYNIKNSIDDAIKNAIEKIYPEEIDDNLDENNNYTIEDIVKEANVISEITQDSTPDIVQNDNIENDDNKIAISGTDITNRQVRFINDFKEKNNIDTKEKFDYYVRTWATNNAIDNISTKKELISAGSKVLDNFIEWINIMQITLNEGVTVPEFC